MFALFRWNLRAVVLFAREMCSLFDTLGVRERLLRVDEGVKSVFSLRTSDKNQMVRYLMNWKACNTEIGDMHIPSAPSPSTFRLLHGATGWFLHSSDGT